MYLNTNVLSAVKVTVVGLFKFNFDFLNLFLVAVKTNWKFYPVNFNACVFVR